MSLYEWLLLFHVAAAFAIVAAEVMFWSLTLASWRLQRPSAILALEPLVRPATALVIAGTLLTLVLGIALAIERDEYQPWDGWIIASIVLWAIASETGRRGGEKAQRGVAMLRRFVEEGRDEPSPEVRAAVPDRTGVLLDVISTVSVLVILVLMIFKPGV